MTTAKPTGKAASRYSLAGLLKHTEATRRSSAALRTSTEAQALAQAFGAFAAFVDELEKRPPTLVKNVSLLLTCRFMNHVYSAMLLVEAGLIADALTCERSALETLAAFRLVSLDGSYAQKYFDGEFPRPVEVRKLIEKAGDIEGVKHIKDLYSAASELAHVTRRHERFDLEWGSDTAGKLFFGGVFDEEAFKHMAKYLAVVLHWFIGCADGRLDPVKP